MKYIVVSMINCEFNVKQIHFVSLIPQHGNVESLAVILEASSPSANSIEVRMRVQTNR